VLHECANASCSEAVGPLPHGVPPKFSRVAVLSGSGIRAADGSWVSGVAPACRAAAVVITLNVDPGGYVSEIARFSSGDPGLSRGCCQASACWLRSWLASRFGSNEGADTMARILPVDGSSATTAPEHGPLQPSCIASQAACCTWGLIV